MNMKRGRDESVDFDQVLMMLVCEDGWVYNCRAIPYSTFLTFGVNFMDVINCDFVEIWKKTKIEEWDDEDGEIIPAHPEWIDVTVSDCITFQKTHRCLSIPFTFWH